jgi:hypothetical protein
MAFAYNWMFDGSNSLKVRRKTLILIILSTHCDWLLLQVTEDNVRTLNLRREEDWQRLQNLNKEEKRKVFIFDKFDRNDKAFNYIEQSCKYTVTKQCAITNIFLFPASWALAVYMRFCWRGMLKKWF